MTAISKKEYEKLWQQLSTSVPANLTFASLVAKQEPINTRFFFSDYSLPILKWIAITVYSDIPVEECIDKILWRYYMFVSSPYESNSPKFYQLTSYKGLNDMKLKTWLKRNGVQYFVKQRIRSDKKKKNLLSLLDFVDYETLLTLEGESKEITDEELLKKKRLKAAWSLLTDKDKDVLNLLVIQKCYWEDAYKILNVYINPKGGRCEMKNWNNKKKQDSLARLKARAIEHLIIKYNYVNNKLK